MSVKISDVTKFSKAYACGIHAGDTLCAINGYEIFDVLDYDFYATEEQLTLDLIDQKNGNYVVTIQKDEYEDIGLLFETYLMDKQRSCKNKCIFCFIDQMPKGMRESLYFKDDDARLSFLFGNYITLTNITSREIERIIKMKISPVNISVHTTNPLLRQKMMNNRFAGEALGFIKQLSDANIKMNCQLVLCPGVNDGDELKRSLQDLGAMFQSVQSIACVPVGLTDHRDGLYNILPYTQDQARYVIDIIECFSEKFYEQHHEKIAYPADEFFIKANKEIPNLEYYGEFSQLENGVGLMTLLKHEFVSALTDSEFEKVGASKKSIITGVDAKPFIEELLHLAIDKYSQINCKVYDIKNDFFGHNITVAGLVTGSDIISQLKNQQLGDTVLIPSCMLRHEKDRFLDDVTIADLEVALKVKVKIVENDGYELLENLMA